ncbi:MAG TPA: hypothetical protein VEC16_02015 [Alphaproteobacteria bacterium]|nr:hypothetical protein [Alphaproteobacteria bacterium]
MRSKVTIKRSTLVVIAVILSAVLFFAGLISGLSYSKFVEYRLEENTKKEVGFLIEYVDELDTELQSLQLQERFIDSMDEDYSCQFSDAYFSEINPELIHYWSILPTRLEEYERNNEDTEEYLALKKEYTKVSLRAWIAAKENYEKCNTEIVPILYFYSKDCEVCVEQGQQLDELAEMLTNRGKSLTVFTVDYNYDEPTLNLIKTYYNITSVPAIIANENVLQGELYYGTKILFELKPETLGDG